MRGLSPKHHWSLFWSSRGSRAGAIILAAGFALSLLVFAGMTVLDRYADRRMEARRLLSDVSGDVDRLQVMPWDAQETLGPDGTRREMRAAEAQLGENLRKLSDATSGDGLSRELTADVARDVQILELLRQKVTDRDAAGALMQRTRSDLVHRVIRADLDLGAAKYEAAATRARSLASVGSGSCCSGSSLHLRLRSAVSCARSGSMPSPKSGCGRRTRWRPSDSSPAASHTTSTIS